MESWRSRRWPRWRARLIFGRERLGSIANSTSVQRTKLVRRGLLAAGGIMVFFTASILWQPLFMVATVVGLAIILQELADPLPFFLAGPWEAAGVLLSRKVRANHFWFHRTQGLLRELVGGFARIDGFATPEGFVLTGAGLNQVRWAAGLAWRTTCQQSFAKKGAKGCKTTRLLLALWLIAGPLLVLGIWRGANLASVLLLVAICGAAGHALAGPAEKFFGPWVERVAGRSEKIPPNQLEIQSYTIPPFLWLKGIRGYQVRIAGEATPAGRAA